MRKELSQTSHLLYSKQMFELSRAEPVMTTPGPSADVRPQRFTLALALIHSRWWKDRR
jgi:hypothetical protein